jgi:hypothetical protein
MLSSPALVRVSAIITNPSCTNIPTQYVIFLIPRPRYALCDASL